MATRKKHLVTILLAGMAVIILGLFVVYLKYGEASRPPVRPRGVPQQAVWAGGPDGGDWFYCRSLGASPTNRFFVTVYAEETGTIVYKGAFRLEGPALDTTQLYRLLGGAYTGDEIFLEDKRKLVAEVPSDSSKHEQMLERKYQGHDAGK
jgi:hypothetical protein